MSAILTIDIGNTAVKAALFRDGKLERSIAGHGLTSGPVESMLAFCSVDGVVVCSVRDDDADILAALGGVDCRVLTLDSHTPLPIAVDYDRSTLGVDRVAAACGVAEEGKASLVVDAGTAVTADVVVGNRLLGGNISPGLRLRFRSLNKFTSRLPLVDPNGSLPGFGRDTDTAIRAGVIRGLAAEILAYFNEARKIQNDLSLVLTGGDAALIRPILNEYGLDSVEDSETVGRGLVRIFNYNYDL